MYILGIGNEKRGEKERRVKERGECTLTKGGESLVVFDKNVYLIG